MVHSKGAASTCDFIGCCHHCGHYKSGIEMKRRGRFKHTQQQEDLKRQIELMKQDAFLEWQRKSQQLLAQNGVGVQSRKKVKKRPRKGNDLPINPFVLFVIFVVLYLLFFKL